MRVLVAGTGSIGRRHIQSLKLLGCGSDIALLRRGGRQDDYSNSLGAHVFSELQEALDTRPDFVVIATPSAYHTDVVLGCLNKNIPFYVEKPVVSELADAIRIKGRIGPDTTALVGCNLRYLPSLQRMKTVINKGELGTVVRADLQAGQWLPDWRPDQNYKDSYSARSDQGGGVLLDLIHEIDMARSLFGEFDKFSAHSAEVPELGINAEAVATCLLRNTRQGPLITIGLDYVSRRPLRIYRVVGTEGSLEWCLTRRILVLTKNNKEVTLSDDDYDFDVSETYVAAMKNLIETVKGREKPLVNLRDGIASTELALQLKEAACL